MTHGMIIDLLTIVVMGVAVYYAIKLNKSLMRARDGRAELTHLIASLTDAQSRAETAIQSMKVTAADYELSLSKQIAISRGLVEELAMINDTSNALATRMERLAPQLRGGGEAYMPRPVEPEAARVERPLAAPADLKAGRSRFAEEWSPPPTVPAQAVAAKVQQTAQPAQAKPVVQAAAPMAAQAKTQAAGEPQPRSRAERELFAAIETLRKGGK